jgi:hypothetical protein
MVDAPVFKRQFATLPRAASLALTEVKDNWRLGEMG